MVSHQTLDVNRLYFIYMGTIFASIILLRHIINPQHNSPTFAYLIWVSSNIYFCNTDAFCCKLVEIRKVFWPRNKYSRYIYVNTHNVYQNIYHLFVIINWYKVTHHQKYLRVRINRYVFIGKVRGNSFECLFT